MAHAVNERHKRGASGPATRRPRGGSQPARDEPAIEPHVAGPADRVGRRARQLRRELMEGEFERIALELFAARGFGAVSVEEIAEVAGVSSRTFYRYFAAKEELLSAFPRRLTAFCLTALGEEPPDRPLFDALSSVLVRLAAATDLDELRHWIAAVITEPAPSAPVSEMVRGFQAEVAPLLGRRAPDDRRGALEIGLAMAASLGAFNVAGRIWYEQGGDFVGLVTEGLERFARGLAST